MVHRVGNPRTQQRDVSPPSSATDAADPPDRLDARLLRIAGVCLLGAVMTILDTTVVNVAQRTFIAEFGSTEATVAWTMTGYTLALSTVIPLTGWAVDRFGTKRLFIASVVLFTAGSLLCAFADTVGLLVAFRVVQGLGGGMLMPLTFTILTREAGPKRMGRLAAVLGVPMLLGPIGGPILGGWLIDAYGWEWIFLINVPIGVAAVILAAIVFPADNPGTAERFDVIGMLLLSPGLAIFLYGVSAIPEYGRFTDSHVAVPALVGLALIVGFVYHALVRADHPLIDLRLFTDRAVSAANGAMLFFAAAFFGASLILPSYFQQLLHLTPLQSGVHLIPQGLGAMVTMPIAGQIVDRRGPRPVVLAGVVLITFGMAAFGYGVWHQDAYLPGLAGALAVIGLGMGCIMMPLTTAAVQTLRPEHIARGSTLINVNQRVAGSVGTAVISVILTHQIDRSDVLRAAEQVNGLQEQARAAGRPVDPAAIPAIARQPGFPDHVMASLAHAYTATFVVAAVLAAVTLVPALLLPKRPPETAVSPAAAAA
ncbi:DHA2 family efflux MFS transporter permease subunit [Mycobacterium sp. MYCO198283]|uniref:DHA2 family efflux MFS transporter permease subunit n=1 Tax=Mycobacterium sp. MYCO198283 TaxID=2883505 RepID=UPI001E3E4768|nr:DHA2 family efflux MFS transporter permease subunit [Mycobacterium sp. MYCO198283]MCG5434032.1 DHA2 family efflux MFS transporter permease subunit [Mycobacterium sp. MYCO198283]